MDLQKIKKLIEVLEQSSLDEIEVSEGESSIRLVRHGAKSADAPAALPAQIAAAAAADNSDAHQVKSPLVGTFFNAASPQDKPYVSVGSKVKKGDTLGLIEAMKTFNQVYADISGTITAINKNNGEPVEFGEPLFVIAP